MLVAVKHQPECDDISVSNTELQVDIVERFLLKCQKSLNKANCVPYKLTSASHSTILYNTKPAILTLNRYLLPKALNKFNIVYSQKLLENQTVSTDYLVQT